MTVITAGSCLPECLTGLAASEEGATATAEAAEAIGRIGFAATEGLGKFPGVVGGFAEALQAFGPTTIRASAILMLRLLTPR
jgi:hypothetical protein